MSVFGAILGSVIRPLINDLLGIQRTRRQRKEESQRQQLLELYKPLYLELVIIPDQDPEHYFSEWDEEEFHEWLNRALRLMLPKLYLLPDELLPKIYGWRETASRIDHDAEDDVRWLYKHIDEKFKSLRKELNIN